MNHAAHAAAHAAMVAQALKASGAIIQLEPQEFEAILARSEAPLVVRAEGGFFSTTYQYLTSYKGLIFYTSSDAQLALPSGTEEVHARKIWIPG